ncbi:serine/threonine-protein kinase, partial [Nocardioides kribbensis]|uniref:serine/threonine-protein kinase n=1 Tax=Nocardioides kribbensis TaxID=305517 RepID=UPI0032DBDBCB
MTPDPIAGRYRIVREIGRGGMGAVWLCHDETLGRDVAVKRAGALPGVAVDGARALREARSAAALNHRNVVSVLDAVEDGGEVWLVMEYVASRNLTEVVDQDGPLTPRRAAAIGAQVADGIAAAHARGTMHRDVKPGNVLVTSDGTAKISDFGIARTAGDDQLTGTGLVLGTPAYFAPELARGGDPTPAADVWALGATLYAAVEGRRAYGEGSALEVLARIADGPPPPPQRAQALGPVIERMMDPDPTRRPSMPEAAESLRALAAGRAVPAGAARADATQVIATQAVATRTVPAVAPVPVPAPTPAGASDDGSRRRRSPWLVAAVVLLVLALAGGAVALVVGDDDVDEAGRAEQVSARTGNGTGNGNGNGRDRSATPTPT